MNCETLYSVLVIPLSMLLEKNSPNLVIVFINEPKVNLLSSANSSKTREYYNVWHCEFLRLSQLSAYLSTDNHLGHFGQHAGGLRQIDRVRHFLIFVQNICNN